MSINVGDRVRVAHNKTFYIAVVLDVDRSREDCYLVRYDGWGDRYDEWKREAFVESMADEGMRPRRRTAAAAMATVAAVAAGGAPAGGRQEPAAAAETSGATLAPGTKRRRDSVHVPDNVPVHTSERDARGKQREPSFGDVRSGSMSEDTTLAVCIQASWGTSNPTVRAALVQALLANAASRVRAELTDSALGAADDVEDEDAVAARVAAQASSSRVMRADAGTKRAVMQHIQRVAADGTPPPGTSSAQIARQPLLSLFMLSVIWHKVEAWVVEDADVIVSLMHPFARHLFPYDAGCGLDDTIQWPTSADPTQDSDESDGDERSSDATAYHHAFFKTLRIMARIAVLHQSVLLCRAVARQMDTRYSGGRVKDIRTAEQLRAALLLQGTFNLLDEAVASSTHQPSASVRDTETSTHAHAGKTSGSAYASRAGGDGRSGQSGLSSTSTKQPWDASPQPLSKAVRHEDGAGSGRDSDAADGDGEIIAEFAARIHMKADPKAYNHAQRALAAAYRHLENAVNESIETEVAAHQRAHSHGAAARVLADDTQLDDDVGSAALPRGQVAALEIVNNCKKTFSQQRNELVAQAEQACREWQTAYKKLAVRAANAIQKGGATTVSSLFFPEVLRHVRTRTGSGHG